MSSHFGQKKKSTPQAQPHFLMITGQRQSSRDQTNNRENQAPYDYKCEWDVPKYCDLQKVSQNAVSKKETIYDQEENISMMPDFGFFGKLK